jgi:hypothetical protein
MTDQKGPKILPVEESSEEVTEDKEDSKDD